MATKTVDDALEKLGSSDPKIVKEGVNFLATRVEKLEGSELKIVLGALYALFYIDLYDIPNFYPTIESAMDVMAKRKEEATNFLLSRAGDSDLKAGMRIAITFGKIGAYCIEPLLEKLRSTRDHYTKTLILYTFGKITDPEIKRVIPDVMDAFREESKEVRDSAARAVGKIVEVVPPLDVPVSQRNRLLNSLLHLIRDPFPGVRSKAIRSLGKMAARNYISDEEKAKAKDILKRLTGQNIHFRWDNAYIVRREAEVAIARMLR